MSFDGFVTWADNGFEAKQFSLRCSATVGFPHPVLANIKTQKIKAWGSIRVFQGMGDASFAWFQFQAHVSEPLVGYLLDLLNGCSVGMQCDKIIGISDDGWPPSSIHLFGIFPVGEG